jgi:prepilin-type N-terminal cleavage/methylation domain-containing protein
MSRPSTSSRPNRRRPLGQRSGFSLIEILVVIGLIAFLTAAIVSVVPRVANASKVAATRATIKKVDEMLNDRINGFRRWIQKQDRQAGNGTPAYVLQAQGIVGSSLSTGNSLAVQKILAQKILFRLYFPQPYSELDPVTQNSNPRGSSHTPITDSAECLYLIITKGPLFDTEPPSAADLKAIETADTDNDGIPEIVDAWGHPLRFYRWPTRLVRPGGYPAPGPPPPPPVPPSGFEEMPLSPATILAGGAAPRNQLTSWVHNNPYNVGATILPATPQQTNPFSLIYRCVASTGNSGTTEPTWPTTVGGTIQDGNVTWQSLLDPLSVDPDDPLGLVPSGVITESTFSTPNTWCTPLIVASANDSDTLGLLEPYDTGHLGNLAMPLSDSTDATTFNRTAMYGNLTNHQQ